MLEIRLKNTACNTVTGVEHHSNHETSACVFCSLTPVVFNETFLLIEFSLISTSIFKFYPKKVECARNFDILGSHRYRRNAFMVVAFLFFFFFHKVAYWKDALQVSTSKY